MFKGASLSRLIKFRALLENQFRRRIIGFDTFSKFPQATFCPDHAIRNKFVGKAGETSISVHELRRLLAGLGIGDNVELVEGDILGSLPRYLETHPQLRLSLLYVDVDLYEPTRACLGLLYPRLVTGGVAILDNYGAFPGANKTIEEFFADTSVSIQELPYSNAISFVVKD